MIVGGFAVNYHRVQRNTGDADFLVADRDYEKVRTILESAGYQLTDKQDLVARFSHDEPFFIDVDIIFTDEKTLKEMIEASAEASVRGEKVLVPSLDHLLAMKLHALKQGKERREPKDLGDVLDLMEKNGMDVDSDRFRALCMKYANEEVYEKIRRALKSS